MNPQTAGLILFALAAIVLIGGIFLALNYTEKKDACIKLSCPSTSSYFSFENSNNYYSCKCPLPEGASKENALCFISAQQAEAKNLTRKAC